MKNKKDNKMVTLTVRFWTNDLREDGEDGVNPKHIWEAGVLKLEENDQHQIGKSAPRPFHSLGDLMSRIELELTKHEIVMHTSRRSRKFRK